MIDEIDQLTTRRDKYLRAAEEQYAEMAPLEALLEGDEELDANRLREVRSEYNTLKLPRLKQTPCLDLRCSDHSTRANAQS
ncbi:hypothetical protein ACP3PM_09045 [Pseudomonas iridis]